MTLIITIVAIGVVGIRHVGPATPMSALGLAGAVGVAYAGQEARRGELNASGCQEDLLGRVLAGEASDEGLRSLFACRDRDTLYSGINALSRYRERGVVLDLLHAAWMINRVEFPEFAWELLEQTDVRVAVAQTLWKLDQKARSEYVAFVRAALTSDVPMERAVSASALGVIGDESDQKALEQMARRDVLLVATHAAAALVSQPSGSGRSMVERLSDDRSLSEERRAMFKRVLAFPRVD